MKKPEPKARASCSFPRVFPNSTQHLNLTSQHRGIVVVLHDVGAGRELRQIEVGHFVSHSCDQSWRPFISMRVIGQRPRFGFQRGARPTRGWETR